MNPPEWYTRTRSADGLRTRAECVEEIQRLAAEAVVRCEERARSFVTRETFTTNLRWYWWEGALPGFLYPIAKWPQPSGGPFDTREEAVAAATETLSYIWGVPLPDPPGRLIDVRQCEARRAAEAKP